MHSTLSVVDAGDGATVVANQHKSLPPQHSKEFLWL